MAEFIVKCPHCNAELQAQEEWGGMELDCPVCNEKFVLQNSVRENLEKLNTPSFIFVCPHCKTQVELPGVMNGQEYECKGCYEKSTAIPAEEKQCPYCRNTIKIQANICKYCKRDVSEVEVGSVTGDLMDFIKYKTGILFEYFKTVDRQKIRMMASVAVLALLGIVYGCLQYNTILEKRRQEREQRIAEEKRIAEERVAEKKRLAEEKRIAEEIERKIKTAQDAKDTLVQLRRIKEEYPSAEAKINLLIEKEEANIAEKNRKIAESAQLFQGEFGIRFGDYLTSGEKGVYISVTPPSPRAPFKKYKVSTDKQGKIYQITAYTETYIRLGDPGFSSAVESEIRKKYGTHIPVEYSSYKLAKYTYGMSSTFQFGNSKYICIREALALDSYGNALNLGEFPLLEVAVDYVNLKK